MGSLKPKITGHEHTQPRSNRVYVCEYVCVCVSMCVCVHEFMCVRATLPLKVLPDTGARCPVDTQFLVRVLVAAHR